MNARRLYGPVVLAILAAGGAVVLTASRPWGTATVRGTGVPQDAVTASGNQAVPVVAALGVVIVTAALAVLATRGRWRRAVGGLVVLLGLTTAVLAASAQGATLDALDRLVAESPSFTGTNHPEDVAVTWWRCLTVLSGVVAATLGVLVVRWAAAWPVMGGRYDAPGRARGDQAVDADEDLWKALDDGRDPTE
ncbi:Trp biosynthesis-associated membrane protein [Aeromicrobium sp. CTD01-1L150]|uniref:Trp biosynthesis-associated membrane protein n=1 Tax=Aeromicrobium sp. CTD01-1L150 TaxID=3341830 RepID=UPI0035BEB5CC